MEFVNTIAEIVHTEVKHHGGAANKNIGDAFLLAWCALGRRDIRSVRDASAKLKGRAVNSGDALLPA